MLDDQQKRRLTWRLIRLVSNVAVITETQQQMGLSTCNGRFVSALSNEEIDRWKLNSLAPLYKIQAVFQSGISFASLARDLQNFDYPADKPRTAATTVKMQRAEQALDNFWIELDKHFVHTTGKTLRQLEENRFQYRAIKRTPPWITPVGRVEEVGVLWIMKRSNAVKLLPHIFLYQTP